MVLVCPFLPGLETTLCGRARAATLQRMHTHAQRLGRVSLSQLERIFGALVPARLIQPTASGHHSRQRLLSLPVMFWAFLAQTLSPRTSCREALRKIIAWRARHELPLLSANTAAYCTARVRMPLATLTAVHEHVAAALEQRVTRDEHWHGHRVLIPDGTGISMPDTPANQKSFPQPSGQKKGCGFPVVKLVALYSLASGALIAWAEGTLRQHDARLWRALWQLLRPGDVIVGDRAFCSFAILAALAAREVACVVRLHQGRAQPLFKKGTRECVVTWRKPQRSHAWTKRDWRALPESCDVRIIKVVVAQTGFRTCALLLATTLLDPVAYPADDLAELYLRRWAVELFFRDIKTSLRMDVLSGKSPAMIRRELCLFAIAYNLVRALMQKAAHTYALDLTRISFKGTVDTIRQWCATCADALANPRLGPRLYAQLIHVIATDRVPLRPGRTEPRAVKRRPKSYKLLNKPRHLIHVPAHHNRPKPRARRHP